MDKHLQLIKEEQRISDNKKLIKEIFVGDDKEPLARKSTAIISRDFEKALPVFKEKIAKQSEEEIQGMTLARVRNRTYLEFKDGSRILWVHPKHSIRGHRFNELYIDPSIDNEFIKKTMSYWGMFCEEEDVHFI